MSAAIRVEAKRQNEMRNSAFGNVFIEGRLWWCASLWPNTIAQECAATRRALKRRNIEISLSRRNFLPSQSPLAAEGIARLSFAPARQFNPMPSIMHAICAYHACFYCSCHIFQMFLLFVVSPWALRSALHTRQARQAGINYLSFNLRKKTCFLFFGG
jgi:hypothetical protein